MLIMCRESISVLSTSSSKSVSSYQIEGQIIFPSDDEALGDTRILVNEGEYIGIPRIDGTFVISGVSSGSHVVSISSPRHIFEPVRVDINANGQIRARKVNLVEPRKFVVVKYPLRFDTYTKPNYFEKREVYHWTDLIFNPMCVPIIFGIISLFFLPKLLSQEQDVQQMLQQTGNIFQPNPNMFDIADWCARWFGGPRRQGRTSQQSIVHVETDLDRTGRQKKKKKTLKQKN
ncbi:unnamed protein product [Rotaria sp. Silwood2]|nr:unnamed protein product [Rotaria sp. Silwood2]CAF3207850.1 unnamed protein product [Rotaria sp. Silwood2]CAF4193280.1 unnamed protein product [Rotaria sp. Silwood2]CAF4285648.1 unnamed protein product [Rotaria sp. Silwood2]